MSSGTRVVNATRPEVSEVGTVERMPAEAVEWRFNIRRDIKVTLILRANWLAI